MLAKLTAKNQITIPKKILSQLPDVEYFDVEINDGLVLLKPVKVKPISREFVSKSRGSGSLRIVWLRQSAGREKGETGRY